MLSVSVAAIASGHQALAQKIHNMRTLEVTAKRPMKEIGIQKTAFDSLALKENIALSMADVLAFNSSVFVKSYGRATLSTVAFRGTSPGHTQVTWNGMHINNPMMGTTDFSTIPAYFIDQASLLHGTSSVNDAGGGLGGLVRLSTSSSAIPEGLSAQYIQGIGSFSTFDEFARLTYANENWSTSTRIVYSSSPNDYKYVNHDKMINIYDDNHNIVGRYHPVERNRSGAFKDFNILQEVYYNNLRGDRLGLNVWYTYSNRELPLISTDYGDEREFENRQLENTLRAVFSWNHSRSLWRTAVKAGYVHTNMNYDYRREVSDGNWADMVRSRSRVNTFYAQGDVEFNPVEKWYFTAGVSAHQHFVRSEDKNKITADDGYVIYGYDKGRIALSGYASAKWQPVDRLGMSLVLRQDMAGDKWAPVIPAFFVDGLISRAGNVMLRASVSRNYKFPSLNDKYFLPGGNPDLACESGFSYDAGISFDAGVSSAVRFSGNATWFDSRIDDWIIWLPTTKGFFSPRNISRVHAYGVELKAAMAADLTHGWRLDLDGSYSWTPSVNQGDPVSPADKSVGKQLPYVPKHSASVVGRLTWRKWAFMYKWCFYSKRYTMSSNDYTLTGHLPAYFMSNVSLEKLLEFRPLDLSVKLAVNNIFNEDYLSVLSRPMPGVNFELFIGITPKFKNKRTTDAVY